MSQPLPSSSSSSSSSSSGTTTGDGTPTNGGGTSVPFQYTEDKLDDCLSLGGTGGDDVDLSLETCHELYYEFLKHYHPNKARLWDKEATAAAEAASQQVMASSKKKSKAVDDDPPSVAAAIVSRFFPNSFDRFYTTLRLVQEHNKQHQSKQHHHVLRLNQFADQPSPFATTRPEQPPPLWQIKVDEIWAAHETSSPIDDEKDDQNVVDDDEGEGNTRNRQRRRFLRQQSDDEFMHGLDFATLLDSPESIVEQVVGKITGDRQHKQSPQDYYDRDVNRSNHTESLEKSSSFLRHRRTLKEKKYKHKLLWARKKSSKKEATHAFSTYYSSSTQLSTFSTASMFTKVNLPSDGTDAPKMFACPKVPVSMDGIEVELYKGLPQSSQKQLTGPGTTKSSSTSSSWSSYFFHRPTAPPTVAVDEDIELTSHDDDSLNTETNDSSPPPAHPFRTSLNWATTHNPDGVPLVHPVFDQGSCGSCWAFAATGSLEASAARNAAREYFVQGLFELEKSKKESDTNELQYEDLDTTVDTASTTNDNDVDLKTQTQIVEAETFAQTNLSIQELLDCDVAADQGCTGGNPLLAFFFIHRYGLVPWQEYPYADFHIAGTSHDRIAVVDHFNTSNTHNETATVKEEQTETASIHTTPFTTKVTDVETEGGKCQLDKIANPVATVQSWGLLHKNYEDLIELALLYVGPVAVGINGADPAFINYGGGIFDSPDCDQGANHALLIVGYGQEEVMGPDGQPKTVRYWIARNSWGAGWGENGFVKVKRGPGGKQVPGVCGIARSPSVALGGKLRLDRYAPLFDSKSSESKIMDTTKYHGDNGNYSEANQIHQSHPFCDSVLPVGSKPYNGCIQISNIYDKHPGAFLGILSILVALLTIIPLAHAIIKRRQMESRTLRLDRDDEYYAPPSRSGSRSTIDGSLAATETTHLLTVKDMYASLRSKNGTAPADKKQKGRCIVVKRPEQNPFHLSDTVNITGVDSNVSILTDTS